MPMSPRTNFHCEAQGLHVFLGKIFRCVYVLCDSLLTKNPKTKLRLRISDREGKHALAQEGLYLQDIFSYINERDTSSLDCKHKHVAENGAPTDKFGVL